MLAQQAEPIRVGQITFSFNPTAIRNVLDEVDLNFTRFGFPRPGLYAVRCFQFVFGATVFDNFCDAPFSDAILALVFEEFRSVSVTRSTRSSATFFIPSSPPGRQIQTAELRAFFSANASEQGQNVASELRLNGKPPVAADIVRCFPTVPGLSFCFGTLTWDFTEEARSLSAQGGGELTIVPDAVPPAQGFGFRLAANYPWEHGGPDNALTLTFEEACPKTLKIEVMPESVRPRFPQNTPLPGALATAATKATVKAHVTTCPGAGSTPASVEVKFELKAPVPDSDDTGGHAHDARPLVAFGSFERAPDQDGPKTEQCTVINFDAQGMGACEVTYHPSQVSGVETIVAEATGFPMAQAKVTVQVPDLRPMPESELGAWRLTGSTGSHPENHFGTPETLTRIAAMATDYFAIHGESLGVNDISLEGGGLFDIRSNWAPPHDGHRIGKSMDIDRCAQSLVKQRDLDRIAKDLYSGTRTVEKALTPPSCPGPPDTPRIHYDFP